MSKPIRCSVAAVVRREAGGPLLAVRRPFDDESLPGVWGLPAVTLRDRELPEAALRRLGTEKLRVELEPVAFLGIKAADRGAYQLILMDIEAILHGGDPDVQAAITTATRYIDQRWVDSLEIFVDAARRGSLCSQLLLDTNGVQY